MNRLVELLSAVFFLVSWLAGVVLAHGFWSITSAIFFPPYAWYLVVERALSALGWV